MWSPVRFRDLAGVIGRTPGFHDFDEATDLNTMFAMNRTVRKDDPFPVGFPSELVSAAFVASNNEVAWRPVQAVRSVEWLGIHGYAVLGTEIWLPKESSIQSVPYFQSVEPNSNERWDLFVARAAAETLTYLKAYASKFSEEGDVYVNVTWVNEAEFRNLKP
jgi:hypothetical protein